MTTIALVLIGLGLLISNRSSAIALNNVRADLRRTQSDLSALTDETNALRRQLTDHLTDRFARV